VLLICCSKGKTTVLVAQYLKKGIFFLGGSCTSCGGSVLCFIKCLFIGMYKGIPYGILDFYEGNNFGCLENMKNKNPYFQPNYHDHIIRNMQEYNRIKNYIINNPIHWEKDTLQEKCKSKIFF
jgi:hypothetical protein